mmetsp:Transcript_9936/g.20248  ORF Transcript_9936/g.20248 Transcript_9936/m.20248 type:complete len:340 (-) Transcript_9936:43-1062(-)|eukprot:CAMPEP_0118644216 /NCGR_PEP_ID=MMETSP0785-20121206/6819_1 /TAXON_ID=91992 /ORGANISM="Bolidomonas pacifica, Strain CCMP 1866" /LENGTH=339 /DNA_ID=CAMNT_0006535957 /DNA_START=276 /DNA_END=1295 /DNA_ORIENTATION=+
MEGFIPGGDEIKGLKNLRASLSDVDSYLNPTTTTSTLPDDSTTPETTPPTTTTTTLLQQSPLPPPPSTTSPSLSYFKAPNFPPTLISPAVRFRSLCRSTTFTGPTNGQCPGFLQCNLVVLNKEDAFDFLLFCQRNPKACPIVDVCEAGGYNPRGITKEADLRTDLPAYNVYENGKLAQSNLTDVRSLWPTDGVAFLLGCSFTFDHVLIANNIPARHIEMGCNVSMYRTNLKCREGGKFKGRVVVTMRPVKGGDVAKVVTLSCKYPQAHGAPIHIGSPSDLGIADLSKPDWGDPVEVREGEVPVFHACGVTSQEAIMSSGVSWAITHSPGCMFVSDKVID